MLMASSNSGVKLLREAGGVMLAESLPAPGCAGSVVGSAIVARSAGDRKAKAAPAPGTHRPGVIVCRGSQPVES
jgi:hypothetical protein